MGDKEPPKCPQGHIIRSKLGCNCERSKNDVSSCYRCHLEKYHMDRVEAAKM